MSKVISLEQLNALYDPPAARSLSKVVDHITPLYRRWIEASRFLVLASVGAQGTDASPRGDRDAVVRVVDDKRLHLPDWRGNNRLDTLRNIIEDGRVSLMFLVWGCENVVRLNGRATISVDPEALAMFQRGPHQSQPATVIEVSVAELYFQCAKAVMRAQLWAPDQARRDVPSAGSFLAERDALFDAQGYDRSYPEYAKTRMW